MTTRKIELNMYVADVAVDRPDNTNLPVRTATALAERFAASVSEPPGEFRLEFTIPVEDASPLLRAGRVRVVIEYEGE